jgi:hypothetical protein
MFETEDPRTSTHCNRADVDCPPSSRRSRAARTLSVGDARRLRVALAGPLQMAFGEVTGGLPIEPAEALHRRHVALHKFLEY